MRHYCPLSVAGTLERDPKNPRRLSQSRKARTGSHVHRSWVCGRDASFRWNENRSHDGGGGGPLWVHRGPMAPVPGNKSDPIQALTGKSRIFWNSRKKAKTSEVEIVSLIFWTVNLWDQSLRVFQKSSTRCGRFRFPAMEGTGLPLGPPARRGVEADRGRANGVDHALSRIPC